jgi:hypothetical protein
MIALELDNHTATAIGSRLSENEDAFLLFFTQLHFHTIEACVSVNRHEPINELELFILEAVELLAEPEIETINGLLHIGRKTIKQVVEKLSKDRLLLETTAGLLKITDTGKDSLQTGELIKSKEERCLFHFLNDNHEFLRINDPRNRFLADLKPHQTDSDWVFDTAYLDSCITQPDEWKKQRQFPIEIQNVINPFSNESPETVSPEQALIVDKAQFANCAVLVKFDEGQPFELSAYPLSSQGHLLSQDMLFSLKGRDSITQVFPDILEPPDQEQISQNLSTLFEELALGEINPKSVKAEPTHISIETDERIDFNWIKFYWKNLKHTIFCDSTSEKAMYLRQITIENKHGLFDAVNLLFHINKSFRSDSILNNISAYRTWLKDNHLSEKPIRELASMAWQLDNYSLAYTLAELEDMADANV